MRCSGRTESQLLAWIRRSEVKFATVAKTLPKTFAKVSSRAKSSGIIDVQQQTSSQPALDHRITDQRTHMTVTTIAQATISDDLDQDDYELELDYALDNCINPWLDAHGLDDDAEVRVRYSGATWQRLSGTGRTTADQLPMIFKFDSDYKLVVKYDSKDQSLTITRYSHDEPTGATHVIEVI